MRSAAISLAGVILLSLASCGDITTTSSETSDSQNADVERPALDATRQLAWGVVSISGGAALEGALVEASSASTTTEKTGAFTLYLSPGPQTIRFSKDGYQTESRQVTGSAGGDTELNVTLASSSGSGGTGGTSGGGTTSGDTYTVTEGSRLERRVSSPGRLTFTITGVPSVDESPDKAHLAWGYEPGKRWTGGQGGGTGAEFGLRNYKLKCYNTDGTYSGSEPRYTYSFSEEKQISVVIEWTGSRVTTNVGGEIVWVDGTFPSEWIVGIGWPPSIRPGIEGARISNIQWPSGATAVQ